MQIEIKPTRYGASVAQRLIGELMEDLTERYGGPDETPVRAAEFDPPNGGFFEFGDSVRVKVNVTDPEDGEIDCSKVEIDYILGHDSHGHPLSSRTGCDVVLPTVADGGHDPSADIFGVINASYTDEGANGVRTLTGEDEVVLQPKRKQAERQPPPAVRLPRRSPTPPLRAASTLRPPSPRRTSAGWTSS